MNDGTMTAGANGARLVVQRGLAYSRDYLTLTNSGTPVASNSGTLLVPPHSFIDNGTITVGIVSVALPSGTDSYVVAAALCICPGGVAHLLGSVGSRPISWRPMKSAAEFPSVFRVQAPERNQPSQTQTSRPGQASPTPSTNRARYRLP